MQCFSIENMLIFCPQTLHHRGAKMTNVKRRQPFARIEEKDILAYRSKLPVVSRSGLTGRRLSARRRRPCQTTAFCRHSNNRCQSVGRAVVLEKELLPPQDHKSGTICRPISDYVGCHTASSSSYWRHFYSDSEATTQCELF